MMSMQPKLSMITSLLKKPQLAEEDEREKGRENSEVNTVNGQSRNKKIVIGIRSKRTLCLLPSGNTNSFTMTALILKGT